MELKVWVDGVVRVVCGLSEDTSCQDVVIALAQAIGQTGRYVLIQRLRDTERQLLANERPLESLAKLGQHGSEVQFFLRRTGPSSSDEPGQDQPAALEPHRRREPRKPLTFNLGPSASPRTKAKQFRRSPSESSRDSPDPRASPVPPSPHAAPSKEEVFRQILQQQEWLQAQRSPLGPLDSRLQEEMSRLEEEARRNQEELARLASWEEEMGRESERERGLRRRLDELHAKLDECTQRLADVSLRSAHLQQEIQRESQKGGARDDRSEEEKLGLLREELQSRQRQGADLKAELMETERALEKAESLMQADQDEMEELNKELRQCNLQQFIQQTGALPSPPSLPSHSNSHTDLTQQLDPLQDHHRSGATRQEELPPRPTAKQFLGHPRNLQNPLVSSLNPEVMTNRESSWR